MNIEPEQISYPFSVYDENGVIIYRDALTFRDTAEFRATSEAEREAMRQERITNWLAKKNAPPQEDQPPIEEG